MVAIRNNLSFTASASKNRAVVTLPCDDTHPSESQMTSLDS